MTYWSKISEAAFPFWGVLSLFQENVDLALHLKTHTEGGGSYHRNFSTMCTQIFCDAGMLPYANVVSRGAGPDDSGGKCWSGVGRLHHPRDHCWVCLTGRLNYRCCLAHEWPPAWRNHPHPPSLSPLTQPLHRPSWLLDHTPAGSVRYRQRYCFSDRLLRRKNTHSVKCLQKSYTSCFSISSAGNDARHLSHLTVNFTVKRKQAW